MARWARLVAPMFPMHVTQRGHNRDVTFRDDWDFARYRDLLSEASTRVRCAIHAYALMSNHVHILLTPQRRDDAARLMQRVGSRYVRYWNRRHGRSGTLWDGRFHSSIVDTDRYVLACCRYIDLNPVRAGIVPRPDLYEWSSYRRLALGAADGLITPHPAYDGIATTAANRRTEYAAYCSQDLATDSARAIRVATRAGTVVGQHDFIASIERQLNRLATRCTHGGDRKSERRSAPRRTANDPAALPRVAAAVVPLRALPLREDVPHQAGARPTPIPWQFVQ